MSQQMNKTKIRFAACDVVVLIHHQYEAVYL